MNLFGRKHSLLQWIIILVLVFLTWMGLAPEWYSWFEEEGHASCIKWLYGLINNNLIINIPLCVCLIYILFCWCHKIWIDSDIRRYRPFWALAGLFILNWESPVTYASIIWNFDYKLLFNGFLMISLLIMLIKIIKKIVKCIIHKKRKPEENKNHEVKGFSNDSLNIEDVPDSLKRYASLIVDRMISTNVNDQSYAIGITGEWGVGKTTFLTLLKQQIGDKAEVIEFNPWMCRTPEQVIRDFFASLRHQLSPKFSTLSKSINDYAKYVSELSIPSHNLWNINLNLPIVDKSLYERKLYLSNKFSNLPHPVVVFIDDIDRLEREEVFEVMRLIRNTADLKNTIYIVAYDKEYVTCVLEEKNIKDASSYLEKIFPLEIHLLKVEEHLIWKTFYDEINSQDDISGRFAKSLFTIINTNERALILQILNNYRRVKRFARLFMMNVSYMNEELKKEIKVLDFFWLELLQMYDKKTYDILANEPDTLLYRDGERFKIRKGVLFDIKEDDKEENNDVYRGERCWKEFTPEILEMIFGNYIKIKKQSICFMENYDKYFTLNVSPYKLSIKEMDKLLANDYNYEEIISKWIDNKYHDSILYQFKQVNINNLKEENLTLYISSLLCFAIKTVPYHYNKVFEVKKLLRENRYNYEVKRIAHNIVISWMKDKLMDDNMLLNLSRLLNNLYVTTVYDDPYSNHNEVLPLIISNDEVEEMLVEVMRNFLKNHHELTALDIMKENGKLAYLFNNCCVVEKDAMVTENYCIYKQVAFDIVIAHFAQKKNKPSLKDFEVAYNEMFNTETPVFVNPDDEDDYWDFMSEKYDQKMQEYFGSSYNNKIDNKLDLFKKECFQSK